MCAELIFKRKEQADILLNKYVVSSFWFSQYVILKFVVLRTVVAPIVHRYNSEKFNPLWIDGMETPGHWFFLSEYGFKIVLIKQ